MKENVYHKNIGIGSLAPFISIFALLFSCYHTSDGTVLAEYIIGPTLPPGIFSIALWGIAIHLSKKYPNQKWAKVGLYLSLAFILLLFAGTLLTFILTLLNIN